MRKRSFSTRSWRDEVSADVSFDRNHRPWKGNERFFSSKDKKRRRKLFEQAKITISFLFGRVWMVWRCDHHDRIIRLLSGKKKKKKKKRGKYGSIYRFILSTEMEEMAVPDFESEVRYIVVEARFTLNYASFILSLSLNRSYFSTKRMNLVYVSVLKN